MLIGNPRIAALRKPHRDLLRVSRSRASRVAITLVRADLIAEYRGREGRVNPRRSSYTQPVRRETRPALTQPVAENPGP